MLLVAKLRYAITFMVTLAKLDSDDPVSLGWVSSNQSLPEGYSEQVVSLLKRHGLILSNKGPGGGYILSRPASEIFLSDVVSALEVVISITRCVGDEKGCLGDGGKCSVHDLFHDVSVILRVYFKGMSLADVCRMKSVKSDISTVYADCNASMPMLDGVKSYLCSLISGGGFANPSSPNSAGKYARSVVDNARITLKKALNIVGNFEVIFTASGTEANNLALRCLLGYKLIISAMEHASVVESAGNAAIITSVDKDGVIDLGMLEQKLQSLHGEKVLISVALVSNEIGVIQPIREVVRLAKKYGALVHTDAVQGCGKLPIDFQALGVDMMTISAHKFGGMVGVAALVFSNNLPLVPIMFGGGQEMGLRSGTENVLAIAAMTRAIRDWKYNFIRMEELARMRDDIEDMLVASGVILFGKYAERLQNVTSFAVCGVPADVQLMYADLSNIAVGNGSACSSGLSFTMKSVIAMGYSEEVANCAVRISLGMHSSWSDVARIKRCWSEILDKYVTIPLCDMQRVC